MTDKELKKKIVEVVNQWHMFQNRDMNGHTIWLTNDSEKLADALIEAGIGDVAELADKWREMLNTQAEKTLEAEHRAEVAERCFDIITTNMSRLKRCVILLFEMKKMPISKAIMQAEKELAEGKEENNAKNQRE